MGEPSLAERLLRAHAYHGRRNAAKSAKIAARPKPQLVILEQAITCANCGRRLPAGGEAACGPNGVRLHVECWSQPGWATGRQ